MRLDNLLAQEKVSRKAMKQALLKGDILVDGCPARSLAQNIDTGLQELLFQDRIIHGYEHSYLMLHKPAGVVTANKDKKLPTGPRYDRPSPLDRQWPLGLSAPPSPVSCR